MNENEVAPGKVVSVDDSGDRPLITIVTTYPDPEETEDK